MSIRTTAKGFKLSDKAKELIEQKFAKIKEMTENLISCDIVASKEHDAIIVHLSLHVDQNTINLREEQENIYKSLELIFDRLARQLRKHKNKSKKVGKEKITDHI
jgi:putative sigma-54 modulation protein